MLNALLRNWYVILATTIFWTDAVAMECPAACSCEPYGKDMFCPPNDPEVHITYRNAEEFPQVGHRHVEIRCVDPKSYNETTDYCSIGTLLNKILLKSNIENVTEIVFESHSHNRTDIIISKDAFKFVQNLNKLVISYSNILTFESDFLRNTPNITVLELVKSGISRIDNYFTYIPKLKYLRLSKNKISSLPNKAFENLSLLSELYLDTNNISNLSKHAFSGLRMLQALDLSHNQIRELTEDNFEDLRNVQYINLGHNRIKNIDAHIFDKNSLVIVEFCNNPEVVLPDYLLANLTSLTTVNLASNNLEEVPENIFRKSNHLKHIFLAKNRLVSLSKTLFRDLYKLRTIDLSGNKLKSLPNNLFATAPMLRKLNLSNNQLSVINKYLFRKLYSIYQIDLHSNKIYLIRSQAFGKQHQSLTYLDLSHNKWNASNANNSLNNCRRLQKLNLSHNKIGRFPYMPALENMKKLDLSYNEIDYFEVKHVIASPRSPTTYDLSNNRIRNISFALDRHMGRKHNNRTKSVLNLSNNPIQCGCSIYDLVRYNSGKNKDLFNLLDIVQDNIFCPGGHNNTPIKKLRPIDVECSVLEGCPLMCKCSFTPYNNAIIIDCALKNLTTYPEIYVEEPTHQQIILNLSGNSLTTGPFQQESYNKVTGLNLSSNHITGIDWIPPYTKELDLSNNSLKNLNSTIIKSLKNSTNLQWLGLSNNPWTCDCEASDFRDYLIENNNTVRLHEVFCKNMDSPLTKISDLCKEFPYLAVLLPIFLCLTVILALCYCYKTKIKPRLRVLFSLRPLHIEAETEEEKIFDIFISYSYQDENFVVDQLLPQLEQGENPFRVCIHVRDWIPGELIARQINKSVQNSTTTLIILSNSFLESSWGKIEFRTAHNKALIDGKASVIVLMYGDIDENKIDDELWNYLNTYTYITWGEKYFWNKMRSVLPRFPAAKMAAHRLKISAELQKLSKNELIEIIVSGSLPETVNNVYLADFLEENRRCKCFRPQE